MNDNQNELIGFEKDIQKGENELLSDNSKKTLSFFRKNRIYIIIFCTLLIIGLIIFLSIYISGKKEDGNKNKEKDEDKDEKEEEEETCEIGEEEKCLTCNGTNCSSCNIGYKIKEGKCILNYSFKAIYNAERNGSTVSLINSNYLNIITEMNVDGRNETPYYLYTFPSKGEHIVYILLDIVNITSLKCLFSYVDNMISISFSELFNTTNITDMSEMFEKCSSLASINFSKSFNTENVKNMNYMFEKCESLTSINISIFQNVETTSFMFSH